MRAKHLGKALRQLAEEGAAQVFRVEHGGRWIVGVAGALQFEVLADRIRTEYDLEVEFDTIGLHLARWVRADERLQLERFSGGNQGNLALDHQGRPVYLARSEWQLKCTEEDWPQIEFLKSREPQVETVAG